MPAPVRGPVKNRSGLLGGGWDGALVLAHNSEISRDASEVLRRKLMSVPHQAWRGPTPQRAFRSPPLGEAGTHEARGLVRHRRGARDGEVACPIRSRRDERLDRWGPTKRCSLPRNARRPARRWGAASMDVLCPNDPRD
jgi:hypothetical protein